MSWFRLADSSSSDDVTNRNKVEDQHRKLSDDLEAGTIAETSATLNANAVPLSATTSLGSSASSSVAGGADDCYGNVNNIHGNINGNDHDDSSQTLCFRPLHTKDRKRIQQLHEEWFPVKYSNSFYDELVTNHRLATSGDSLFTCVGTLAQTSADEEADGTSAQVYCQTAGGEGLPPLRQLQKQQDPPKNNGIMVGCCIGAFLHHSRLSPEISELLVPNTRQHSRVFYIMTLGTVSTYRNLGVATALIQKCRDLIQRDPSCGALYLHVITHNHAAIQFYEKLGFYRVKTIRDYYTIDGVNYDCYLYAAYFHGTCIMIYVGGYFLTVFLTTPRYVKFFAF